MNKKPTILVYPKLPRTGLGNMLFIWANAVLFSHINDCPVVTPNWNVSIFRLGPYLRGERYKRFYGNLFSPKGYFPTLKYWLTKLKKRRIIYNHNISQLELSNLETKGIECYVFIFDRMIRYGDCFMDLREHQSIIKQKLFSSIRPSVYKDIATNQAPEIGIHVRLSDFKTLKPDEDFASVPTGFIRTPMSWYIGVVSKIREIAGYNVPATIFSDGYDHEMSELLSLPNVSRSPHASALSDMLTLSRSKILIASPGSTFSCWASYLGQCPTIWHPQRSHASVLTSEIGQSVFEGSFDPESTTVPELLSMNIKSAFNSSIRI
ncbi:glycosyl transferase [Nostoc parmelioides]|uniref:Glycosyl transferase n=1 Tax=Nostoc parmelioides FACHB-3921 TaxID=2692909 RepID=A0ABR8BL37_9NOSO|nr:glycosyl transferase [Nostoc parmelioides]MBD2254581.1 glycosyl transferase [Nostoc parmelioides FACHB-3921]